jgi:DNA-binding NtrC family response regulator
MEQPATISVDSSAQHKPILIVDESRFSRICSAILELGGFSARSISDAGCSLTALDRTSFALVIMSYPFGSFLLEEVMRTDIPVILLADHLSSDVVKVLSCLSHCHCMIKPIDYQELLSVVRERMNMRGSGKMGCKFV